MLLDISILPQTSEELFYFVTKRIPYLCGVWRFANAYKKLKNLKGDIDIIEDLRIAAMKPLDRMLEMTRK